MAGTFELHCMDCEHPVTFSLFELESQPVISCAHCGKKYGFSNEREGESHTSGLKRQLSLFAALCRQIQESKEILGNSSVGVSVGREEVNIPLKLLLSRLRSSLDLNVGGKRVMVTFRVEPVTL